jgi:hypothetical protein
VEEHEQLLVLGIAVALLALAANIAVVLLLRSLNIGHVTIQKAVRKVDYDHGSSR